MGRVGRTEKKKANKQTKGTAPGPALIGGVGRTRKKKHRNQADKPNHTRDAPNPDIKIPKHLKQPKEKDEDLKTQKTPGTTQREKLRSQDAKTTRNNPRRRTQKSRKLSSAAAA